MTVVTLAAGLMNARPDQAGSLSRSVQLGIEAPAGQAVQNLDLLVELVRVSCDLIIDFGFQLDAGTA
jgi:hypothetical protein